MSVPVKQASFSSGEISPTLFARTDQSRYESGLRTCRNMIIMRQGGATGRPGTEYVSTAFNVGAQVRLIPFIFNETGVGQSYVLEFGNQYIAFHQNGGNVISSQVSIATITLANPAVVTAYSHGFSTGDIVTIEGVQGTVEVNNGYFIVGATTLNTFALKDLYGNNINSSGYPVYTGGGTASNIYFISSPYLQADLPNLKFAESGDIVTITHPGYPPAELKRFGATNWTLSNIVFGPTIGQPGTPSVTGGLPGTTNRYYTVTALGITQEEGNSSQGGLTNIATPTQSSPISISWSAVGGAIGYKIYFTSVGTGASGYLTTTIGNSWSDDGTLTPDYAHNPPLQFTPFGSTNNYPATVGFVQQRRCFAATNNNPIGFWMSNTGDYYNFNTSVSPTDSDSIISSLAGEEVNAIQHLFELKFMLMLTSGAEIYVQGNGSGVVTPSAINASTQSQYGASPLRPLKVGDIVIFNQALGSFIRDFAFDFAIDGYRGNDITIFASHLFEGYQLVDWCYQKVPDSIIWAVRSDGVLLSCTYVREQQVFAWAHHDFTNGFVENVCSIPENGQYAVYASIRRTINGVTLRYIERISSRIWTDTYSNPAVQNDPLNAAYLDSYIKYDGRNTNSSIYMNLSVSGGGAYSQSSTAYQQTLGLKSTNSLGADTSYFSASMVGSQIFIQDQEFINSQGRFGNQIRLTIQTYVNASTVQVTPSGIVPTNLQNSHTILWSVAISTLNGLGYLEGQKVSVWADRFVVGSPLNSSIDSVYTVTNGVITLDKPYSVIYVGLPMIQDVETLDIESYFGETMLGRRKRMGRGNFYVYNTRSFFAGSENPDTNLSNTTGDLLFQLFEEKDGRIQGTYDEPPQLMTNQEYVITSSHWSKQGTLFMRNVDPVPFTILAIAPASEDPVQTPYKRL